MKTVYIFPGQGSQYRTMGHDLFEKFPDIVAQANKVLGYDIAELCLEDPNRVLNQTQYTQPALYTVNALTYLDRMARGEPEPDILLGHSLGEYNALFVAGAFDFSTGLMLVKKRGELMSNAPKGAMVALLGISLEKIQYVLNESGFSGVNIANINSREQCIISGIYEEVLAPKLEQQFVDAGARFIRLNVSAAFHSYCMVDIEKEFGDFVAKFPLNALTKPVVSNCTASLYPDKNYQHLLTQQISNSVRWYESISWLLARGFKDFVEVGPGDVLSKIQERITDDPMLLPENNSTPPMAEPQTEFVFMYAGQGSQYYQMGRALYQSDAVFKQWMDKLSYKVTLLSGINLLETLYGEQQAGEEFDDIRYTHPALFCIGYSLTQVLLSRGIKPSSVVGHSLGEYIAAAVAGLLQLDDALKLIVEQANILTQEAPQGGLIAVIADPELFHSRNELFAPCTLAGINFNNSFFISGNRQAILQAKQNLTAEGTLCVVLPVRYGFHSDAIDAIAPSYQALLKSTSVYHPKLPIYSSVLGRALDASTLENTPDYLWKVIRKKIDFQSLVKTNFCSSNNQFFIDLSATGSLSNFLKYSGEMICEYGHVLDQFGDDVNTLDRLLTRATNVMN